MKPYQVFVFDLDGTLLDTLGDLTLAVNYALHQFHLPEHSKEDVRHFVGDGVRKLLERAVPKGTDNQLFEQILECFKNYYQQHDTDTTRPYHGIVAMLRQLKQCGVRTAVVSNKFNGATQHLCHHFFGSLIDAAVGEHEAEGIRKKPAPDTVFEALKMLNVTTEHAVYVGDSDVDILTATHAGMPCLSVTWGFRGRDFLISHGAVVLIDRPEELLSYACNTQNDKP